MRMAKQEPSLVLELQQLAADSSVAVSDLLRKALIVAAKLNLAEFRGWINSELNGYENSDTVPEYRKVHASLRLKNPYHGLVPFVIDMPQLVAQICEISIMQPVGELHELLQKGEDGTPLVIPFSHGQMATLMKMQEEAQGFYLEPVRTIARSQVAGALDGVRNKILAWSLELESEGVLGTGLSFSNEEKARAAASPTVNNFFPERMHMGDYYSAGQAGAMGPGAKAHDMHFQQIWQQQPQPIDLDRLAAELAQLRTSMKESGSTPEHDIATAEVARAESAAKARDGGGVLRHLQAAGKWAWETANKIGVALVVEAIKQSMK
jgi:hypothetical protein